MKLLILGLSLLSSAMCFAGSCEEKVLNDYIISSGRNEHHHLTGEVFHIKKFEKSLTTYGTKVELGFDMDIEVYLAGSEYMGGYGVEAIVVNPATCETLKMVMVYAE